MIYLAFAILTSASIALIFKFSEGRNMERYVVTSFNYLAASLVSIIIIIANDLKLPFISFPVTINDLAGAFPPSNITGDGRSRLIWPLMG